jgi:hypothetical protein
MNKIKIPLITAFVIFILAFFMNIASGNSFLVIILRSFVSFAISFGLIFGASYVLTDILKIDFSPSSEPEEGESHEESKVNIMVDDMDVSDLRDESPVDDGGDGMEQDGIQTGNDSGENDGFLQDEQDDAVENGVNGDEANSQDENTSGMNADNTADINREGDDTEGKKDQINVSSNTVKDKLGINASTEDLVKAIRTKISKDG